MYKVHTSDSQEQLQAKGLIPTIGEKHPTDPTKVCVEVNTYVNEEGWLTVDVQWGLNAESNKPPRKKFAQGKSILKK